MISVSNTVTFIRKVGKPVNTQTKQEGFSIIEVVLVLAIAALIFLMIFVALPALQRGQRDTARKQDANTVATALNTWRGNHRGSLPANTADDKEDFATNYVKKLGQYDVDPQGTEVFEWGDGSSDKPNLGEEDDAGSLDVIGIALEAQCTDNGDDVEPGSRRSAAVVIRLEASKAVVCVDA